MMDGHFGIGAMWIMWLVPLLIIWGVYLAAKGGPSSNGKTEDTPLDILKKRYAKGEITKKQFDEMRRIIS